MLKALDLVGQYTLENLDEKALTSIQGHNKISRQMNATRLVRVAEAARLWADFREGRVDPFVMMNALSPQSSVAWGHLCHEYPRLFTEAMTVSDFASLSDEVLDRALLENWRLVPPTYPAIAKVREGIRDFRQVKKYYMDGMRTALDDVGELEPFHRRAASQGSWNYTVKKYEGGYALSWESVINDNLDIFTDFPARMSDATRVTHEKFVTQLYCDTNGPHASFFTVGNSNIITSNAVLGLAGLQTAFSQLLGMTDVDGNPITMMNYTLVVGSGSQFVIAQNLKNQLSADVSAAGFGGSTTEVIRINNWIIQNFSIVFNPWIPLIATGAPNSWFLFANPASTPRPALEVGFLQGYRDPVLFKKAPNAMRIGGGLDQAHGDFETMGHEYKVMTVFGGTRMEPKAAVGSNNSGS